MTKAQKKRQPTTARKTLRRAQSGGSRTSEVAETTGISWSTEIKALQGRTFSSLEHAITELADVVLTKVGSPASQRDTEKKYLVDLLKTDEEVCSVLRSALKIR